MDNQFTAPNDSAIDYQLRLRGRLIAGADPRSLADVLNSVGKRIAGQDLVLLLFLDEVIQELAIFITDIPSRRTGSLAVLSFFKRATPDDSAAFWRENLKTVCFNSFKSGS